jgi:hypothetical protein
MDVAMLNRDFPSRENPDPTRIKFLIDRLEPSSIRSKMLNELPNRNVLNTLNPDPS